MEKDKKLKRNILIVLAVAAIVLVFVFASCTGRLFKSFSGIDTGFSDEPEGEYFAIIPIYGTIQATPESPMSSTSYDHAELLSYIDELMEDENNKGILLDVDSGGGTVYHSDEMYLKLIEYKETTGRPISAYFESTAASGAYYISCSADSISANRNCWTGSIGVIISYINYKGLYDKLGLEEIIIASGENKGMGSSAGQLTDEQRRIYQSLVDESYNRFVEIVASARGMSGDEVRALADGRVYTAAQALGNGLIDKIETYDEAVADMKQSTGAEGYYKYFDTEFSLLDYFTYKISEIKPKNDIESLEELAGKELSGVPLYLYRK